MRCGICWPVRIGLRRIARRVQQRRWSKSYRCALHAGALLIRVPRVSAPTDSCGQSLQCKGRLLTFVNPMLHAWGVLSPSLQLVDTFPVDDLTNEAVSDTIDKIRGKFKSAVSQLGMVRGDVTKQGGLAF